MQPLLKWNSNEYYMLLVWVCSLRYPAYNANATFSSVAHLALQYFSTLSHKQYDFREKVTEYKMCVMTFCTTFV